MYQCPRTTLRGMQVCESTLIDQRCLMRKLGVEVQGPWIIIHQRPPLEALAALAAARGHQRREPPQHFQCHRCGPKADAAEDRKALQGLIQQAWTPVLGRKA